MIDFVVVKRNLTVGSNPGEKFMARLFRGPMVSQNELCSFISESTTLSRGEVKLVVDQLQFYIRKFCSNSQAVKLDDLGIFAPRLQVKAVNTAAEVTADTIRRKSVIFRPCVELQTYMNTAESQKKDLTIMGLQQ